MSYLPSSIASPRIEYDGPYRSRLTEIGAGRSVISVPPGGARPKPHAGKTPVIIGMGSEVLLRGFESIVDEFSLTRVAGTALGLDPLLALCRDVGESVALVELSIARRCATDLLDDLRRVAPRVRTVLLADETFPRIVRTAIQAGACGLICKEASLEEILAALSAVAQGRRYVAPGIGAALAEGRAGEDLTQRELEVLGLLSRGDCNKAIARSLDVTEGTVKSHVRSIMTKLESRSRTEAMHRAYQLGLVSIGA